MGEQKKVPAEAFAIDMNIVMSRYHSNQMAENVRRGMLHRAMSGYAVTRPPLGYSATKTPGLYKINRRGKAMHKILNNYVSDDIDFESVSTDLTSLFCSPNTKCVSWDVPRVKRLLSNPYYLGYIRHGGQLYPGLHEPLFSEEEHKNLWMWIAYAEIEYKYLRSVDKNIQKH